MNANIHSKTIGSQEYAIIICSDNLTKKAGPGAFNTMYDIVPVNCPDSGNRSYWTNIPKIPDFLRSIVPTSLFN